MRMFVLLSVCIAALACPAAATYKITDLGNLPGGWNTQATGINNLGQVVCNSYFGGGVYRVFIWQDGVITDCGTLTEEAGSYATGIRDNGQVIGMTPSNGLHVFQRENGGWTDLGALGGNATNDKGQIVGILRTADNGFDHAGLWTDGTAIDLGTLAGGAGDSYGSAINNSGQVVGGSATSDNRYHAFLWQNGAMTDLGTLGGNPSDAHDINDLGQVVGVSNTSDGYMRGFLWQNGVMVELGTLESSVHSIANGINDHGEIVGYSIVSRGGVGYNHAVLWQPVPEPSSILALLSGLGGFFVAWRRK